MDAAICTSATLTVYSQGFDFFLRRVGLERERVEREAPTKQLITRELPHAFDYYNNALLVLPNNLPAPRDSELKRNFQAAVADLLRRFIPTFKGRTLGLFTANSRRDYVYEQIVDELAEKGYPLLSQGQGSLRRLIDDFRDDNGTSLPGTRSLWEGVDVPGESLSYVFLEKLPYPSLGDPVEAARMGAVENAGGNSFYDYLLPKMVILLKQRFGRLIRSTSDRGAVILLDKRLRSSLYRHEVLASLPDPTLSYASDQARVLLYAFESEGLLQRGVDCTLEATILLTQPLETLLTKIADSTERVLAERLFRVLKAELEHQVSYRAAEVYERSGIDPRLIDPFLVKLAAQELLLYRAYTRGITLKLDERIRSDRELSVIEGQSSRRYQRFEQRLQAMIDYANTKRDQNHCRSADLVDYLTGENNTPACGKCDLCSPTYAQLPWRSDVRLYGERLEIDTRMAVLGTIRDHNNVYGRRTIERILLGKTLSVSMDR